MAAQPVIRLARERLTGWEFVLSVITPGGHETASKFAEEISASVVYLPFDLPWTVRRALNVIQPDVLAIFETEIWPNLLHHAQRHGARIALLNGRISDRSVNRYCRLRPLFAWALGNFDRLLAQSERDADRLRSIGGDPSRIAVLGNSKFDEAPARLSVQEVSVLRADLGLPEDAPVLVVGSTRSSEEEHAVLNAYCAARETLADLVLIHAPRHVERAGEVEGAMRARGLEPARRSTPESVGAPIRQLILDTFGELARVYAVADVVFVGNSLFAPGGGQNLLQPLAQGKPVIHGPFMGNFRDTTAMAKVDGVAFCVHDSQSLTTEILRLLRDAPARAGIAERAVSLIDRNRGAAQRYADALVELAGRAA